MGAGQDEVAVAKPARWGTRTEWAWVAGVALVLLVAAALVLLRYGGCYVSGDCHSRP